MRPSLVLAVHMLGAMLVQSTGSAGLALLPILALKEFDAGTVQSVVITAAPLVFYAFSIFWNDAFSRRRMGSYLLRYWLLASLPMAAFAIAPNVWVLIGAHLVASLGGAGWPPAQGELLRGLYDPARRGRAYGIMWGGSMIVGALLGWLAGKAQEHDARAYTLIYPGVVLAQGVGLGLLAWLSVRCGHDQQRSLLPAREAGRVKRLVEPITHMKDVLRADPVFARYEAAYMTYGVGWMIAYALLPILATEHLKLSYEQVMLATQVPYQLALVATLYPAGLLLDRLGAIRATGLSFVMLSAYPLALIFAHDFQSLLLASVLYGIAHAGASVGWMLGPVSLAPTPDKVPTYVAIHATFVGIRGKLFQFLGMGLYMALGLWAPLAVAAGAYAWSGWQMRQLDRRVRAAKDEPVS
jgi:MFS family permease